MIRKNRPRASSLFLMELIIAILFFSIASAVCVQFFVKSHLLSRDADALNHAVNECSSVAEALSTADSISSGLSLLSQLYPNAVEGNTAKMRAAEPGTATGNGAEAAETDTPGPNSDAIFQSTGTDWKKTDSAINSAEITFYYDDEFLPCKAKNADYVLSVHLEQSGQMLSANMKFCPSGKEAATIYELNTNQHIPRRTGHEKR